MVQLRSRFNIPFKTMVRQRNCQIVNPGFCQSSNSLGTVLSLWTSSLVYYCSYYCYGYVVIHNSFNIINITFIMLLIANINDYLRVQRKDTL